TSCRLRGVNHHRGHLIEVVRLLAVVNWRSRVVRNRLRKNDGCVTDGCGVIMSLKATNLGYRYGRGPWLFRRLNFHVNPGEIVGIRGPSGVGKTTLARLLAGYEQPQEGTVRLHDQPLPVDAYCPVQLVWQHPEQAVNPRWRMRETHR